MSAYYMQHNPGTSPTRIRQEGFNVSTNSPSLNAPPSPTTPFDSQNAFFAGSHNVFPNAFKKFNDRNAIDFSDTLASIMTPESADDPHRQGPSANPNFRHSLDYPSGSTSGHTHSQSAGSPYFDISSYPAHLNNFRGGTTDPTSPAMADASVSALNQPQTTAASLGHNYIGDPPLAFHHAHTLPHHRASFGPPPVLPRLNTMRTTSPSTNNPGSTSDMNVVVPSSPFSPGAVGIQPSSGAVRSTSRSRSRSRPAAGASTGPGGVIERNPSVSARSSRVAKKRTASISSPSPPGGTPGSIANAGVVQSAQQQQSQHQQQQQQPQPLAMSIIIPDPRSAQAHHNAPAASPATTAASWVFSPSSAHTAFSLPNGESTAATSFNNTFAAGGQSLPMVMDDEKTPPTKEDPSSKQVALLNEKRRRRRESHNAVERRRRDNINEKINELATLIPECLLLESSNNAGLPSGAAGHEDGANEEWPHGLVEGDPALANGSAPGYGAPAAGSGDDEQTAANAHAAMKANKGVILRKSVDYIRYLQQLVQAQSKKNHDLEIQLAQYRNDGGQGHQSMPSQGNAEDFSSSPGPSDPSGSGHGNMMFLPPNDGSSGVDAFGNAADFGSFDFSRFTQPNGGEMNHLVSVKEEDPSGMMDMNILPDEHQLPPPQPHQFMHNGYEHHPHAQFDLASLPPFHPQNGYIPSPSHQQVPPHVHQQQQQMHQPVMEPSPSAAGSGSNISDLEDVEEEDEGAEGVIVDNSSNNSQPRGRKELRDAQSGRFAHSPSASLGGGRNDSSRSVSKDPRAKLGLGPRLGTPNGGDVVMHTDERP